MKMFRVLVAVIVLTLILNPAIAQEDYHQNIKGRVLDKVSRKPLPGATVVIPDSSSVYGTTTDNKGYFKLEDVEVGRTTIKVSYMGYKTEIIPNILLKSGKGKKVCDC